MKINKFKKIAMMQIFLLTVILNITAQAAGIDPRVVQELTVTGQVKTVIALNLPETAPNRLRAASAAMRDPIGEVQEEVLNSLPTGSYELTYQYSHVPGLAMTVTPESFAILKDHPQVKYIQYDELEHIALAQATVLINANQVWALNPPVGGITGAGVTVAVLDTGIKTSHEDFTVRIATEQCFLFSPNTCPSSPHVAEDDNGHGTHVAGIVVADGIDAANTPKSYKGVAPGAQVAAVKVCNNSGDCSVSDIIAGLDWVRINYSTHGIKVVNMSIASSTLYSDSCDQQDVLRKEAIDELINKDITVFAAAGNNGDKTKMGAPACLSNTIAVGATYDADLTSSVMPCVSNVSKDDVACFSNSGNWLDILAPGSKITSSWIGSTTAIDYKDGTSMASPMASGVAALMLEKNSNLTPAQIKAKLKKTGVDVTDTNGITRPRIDALAAVNDASNPQPIIEVQKNGKAIPEQSVIDFGYASVGDSVTQDITIKNIGNASLNLTWNLPSGFITSSSSPVTISSGNQQTIQIQLDTTTANTYTGVLQFTDMTAGTFKLNVQGTICTLRTIPFSENFESGSFPACWQRINFDDDSIEWNISNNNSLFTLISGTRILGIERNGYSTGNDWLILPQIRLGNNSKLLFKVAGGKTNDSEFDVKLSTTGNNLTNFTTDLAVGDTVSTGTIADKDYSLANYAGQNVYLAIRAYNPNEAGSLSIDDISVTDAPNYQNSTPTINSITTTVATLTVQLDEAGTVYYLVLSDSSVASAGSTPDAAQVMTTGQNFVVSAANTTVNQSITGLSPDTAYTVYLVAKDVSGNTSAVTPKSFHTATVATDTTPPSFASGTPSVSGVTTSSFTLTLGSNETSTVDYVVLPNSSATPTATDIKNMASGFIAKGSFNLSANTPISPTITGLTATTTYQIYAVLTDSASNQSTVASTSAVTAASVIQPPTTSTPSVPPSYTVIERKDGTGTGKITSVYVGQSGWTSLAALSATPDPDSVFVKWTGNIHSPDCYSDQPTIYVRLNAIKTCTATFDKITADNQSLVPVKLAAYYLPGIENSGRALIRMTNTNLTPVIIKGTLYHASGQRLGIANSTLIQNLAPQATTELTTQDLAKLCSAPEWTGLAWLHITTPSGLNLLNLLENDNKMVSNLTTVSSDNVLYNLPPSTNSEQSSILLINTSDKIQSVTATLYGMNGQILGQANTVLADVAARGIFSLSIKQLEVLVGAQPWTDQVVKLQISTPDIKTMAISLSQEGAIVNLTPTHDNAAFNIPGATNLDQALIYITNTTNSAVPVTATLYHQDGYLLGTPNTLIINSLAPQATQLFSVSDLEKLFGVPTWQKRARLMISNPVTGIKVMTLINNDSKISNLSPISNQVYYLPNANHIDKAYIRITNTADSPVTVSGTLYGKNGQILGSGTLVSELTAQTTTVISMPLLETLLKITSWTDEARLVINPTHLQVMGTIRANNGQLLDMSDIGRN